jgi:pimeloyl-ACP methyl ester carboxylesterase
VTHPWPGGIAWHHHVITAPLVGYLFARTLAYPVGKLLIGPGARAVFAPRQPPPDYLKRASSELILRPNELTANAEDVSDLHAFVTAQAPRYALLQAPAIIITGDIDDVVSPETHARTIAAVLPRGKPIVLPGAGHMLQFSAADEIVQAIAELVASMP